MTPSSLHQDLLSPEASMQRKTYSVCKNKLLVPQRSRELITLARHLEGKWHSYNNRSACLNHKLQLHTLNATGLNCEQNSWPVTSSCFTRLRPFTEFNSSLFSWVFMGQAPSLKIKSHVCYLWQTVWPPKPGMQSWSCRSWAPDSWGQQYSWAAAPKVLLDRFTFHFFDLPMIL